MEKERTIILLLPMEKAITMADFVGTLQTKLKGIDFGELGYGLRNKEMCIFREPYLPSLDGFANLHVSGIFFSKLIKPPRIAHLLSTVRVAFRGTGFDCLMLQADEMGGFMAKRTNVR